MDYKVICAGSRDFSDQELVFMVMDYLLRVKIKEGYLPVIVNGMAKGADALGGCYAKAKGYPQLEYFANWNRDGKAAGPIRNKLMGDVCDAGVVFLKAGGVTTPGSLNMYRYLISLGKPVYMDYRVGDLVVLERGQVKFTLEIIRGGEGVCLQIKRS